MPTGYTNGILTGKINTFPEFAKLCMKAFGACVHMRDDDMNAKYEPRTPSDYHIKALEEARKKLKYAETVKDDKLIASRKDELLKERKDDLKTIKEIKANRVKLDKILEDAKNYIPPTPDHEGVKQFMIEQITSTIKYDGDTKYPDERIAKIDTELANINASMIRAEMIEQANKDIAYHLKEYKEELQRCNESNMWVTKFIDSLPKQL